AGNDAEVFTRPQLFGKSRGEGIREVCGTRLAREILESEHRDGPSPRGLGRAWGAHNGVHKHPNQNGDCKRYPDRHKRATRSRPVELKQDIVGPFKSSRRFRIETAEYGLIPVFGKTWRVLGRRRYGAPHWFIRRLREPASDHLIQHDAQ